MTGPAAGRQRPVSSTFGHWRRPASPGLFELGAGGTAVLLVGLVVAVLVSLVSWVATLVALVVLVVVLAPLAVRQGGRSGAQRLLARVAWWRGRRRRRHLYRSGVCGLVPGGTHRLPGLAAASELYEAHDAYERPFGIVAVPSTGHYSVVLRCEADGAALVDQEQVESWVASWGGWLAGLGHEPGLVAAAVTVETAPDPGTRLEAELARQLSPAAPAFAGEVLQEVLRTYPAGSAVVSTRVQLTYRAAAAGAGGRGVEQVAVELGSRVPGLAAGLASTGAGAATAMTAGEIAEAVRVGFDPAAGELLDRARDEVGTAGWNWADVGPAAAQETWNRYRHDSGVSLTWSMSEAPRGTVLSGVLTRLVAPHPDVARKRVTLLFRPHDPGTAATLVEADVRTARFLAGGRARARGELSVLAAEQSAREEAAGAGLVRFGLLVTATVLAETDVRHAAAVVDNLAASARLQLRRVYGSQAASFAAGLPVGIVLPEHLRVPALVSEALR